MARVLVVARWPQGRAAHRGRRYRGTVNAGTSDPARVRRGPRLLHRQTQTSATSGTHHTNSSPQRLTKRLPSWRCCIGHAALVVRCACEPELTDIRRVVVGAIPGVCLGPCSSDPLLGHADPRTFRYRGRWEVPVVHRPPCRRRTVGATPIPTPGRCPTLHPDWPRRPDGCPTTAGPIWLANDYTIRKSPPTTHRVVDLGIGITDHRRGSRPSGCST